MTAHVPDYRDALLHEDLIVPLHRHVESDNALVATLPGAEPCVVTPAQAGAIAQARARPGLDEVDQAPDGPRRFSRRGLVRGGVAGIGALLAASAGPRMAFAAESERDLLVVIFLRGGMDGLSAVFPVDDPAYYAARPLTAVRQENAFDLDGRFAMNANMSALKPMWAAGQLGVVVGSGALGLQRSHFVDSSLCELGGAPASTRSGWLGRHLETSSSRQGTFRAITVGSSASLSLTASFATVSMSSIADFDLKAWKGVRPQVMRRMDAMYSDIGGQAAAAASRTLDAVGELSAVRSRTAAYRAAQGASYPDSAFGRGLSQIAQMAKGATGLEVACIDIGDWDMHQKLGEAAKPDDWFSSKSRDLAEGLAALRTDLGPRWASTTVVTMSEFGRRVSENGDHGFDHGSGNLAIVAGGGVHGGVYGSMPSLRTPNLHLGDVPVTTDYRQALSEIVAKRLGNGANLASVFPGFTPAATPLGIV